MKDGELQEDSGHSRVTAEPKRGWTKGRKHTAETKRRISQSIRRLRERRVLRPKMIDRWLQDGVVSDGLRPIVDSCARQRVEMAEAMGDDRTPMQEAALDSWFRAEVPAVALSLIAAQEGYLKAAGDRLPAFLSSARSALKLIRQMVPDATVVPPAGNERVVAHVEHDEGRITQILGILSEAGVIPSGVIPEAERAIAAAGPAIPVPVRVLEARSALLKALAADPQPPSLPEYVADDESTVWDSTLRAPLRSLPTGDRPRARRPRVRVQEPKPEPAKKRPFETRDIMHLLPQVEFWEW